jgi:hypothetical protein
VPRALLPVFTRFGLPLFLLLLAACGGDDDPPVAPLGPPPVNPSFQVLTQGDLVLDIAPDDTQKIQPDEIMHQAGKSTPCVSLIFLFTYRIDGRKDAVQILAGPTSVAAEGPEGGASIGGCTTINVKNVSNNSVKGTMRYVVAQGLQKQQ